MIWDAVFQELVYESQPLDDPVHRYKKTVTISTISKAYCAPGLRFGWVIGPQDLISSCVRQKDYGNLFVAPIIVFVAEKMLANLGAFSVPRLAQAKANRERVNGWVKQSNVVLDWWQPDGGVCGLVELPPGVNDFNFCRHLLKKTAVLLVPGRCFDMPGYVRLGFGGNEKKLTAGLNRIEQFLPLIS